MSAKLREERAQRYWVLSRQWRGDSSLGAITVGDLLSRLADLAGSLNNLGWQRAENHVATLLSQVINNKRSRKRKPTNNIVQLHNHVVVHVPTGKERHYNAVATPIKQVG